MEGKMDIEILSFTKVKEGSGKRTDKIFKGSDGEMYSSLEMEALINEPWNNNACLGYAILAMEKLDFPADKIRAVARMMRSEFDVTSTSEAAEHYCKGSN